MSNGDGDYEASEAIAIAAGKDALKRAPWLFNRRDERSSGFFAELRSSPVHPDHLSVHCVDGVGTKLFLSPWSGNYRLAPIDGVAMNANDMATLLHAFPSEISLYLAMQTGVEEEHMGTIMHGFVDAAERIRIPGAPWDLNIGKIETASLDEMIALGLLGKGADYGVVMTGFIARDKVPNLNPQPGHYIVGVSSSGMHSNGFTGGRHVLLKPDAALEPREEWRRLYKGRFGLHDRPDELEGKTVLEAMQVPTALYMVEAALIGREFDDRNIYGINITGNGLHNFNRKGSGVSFEITDPFEPLPIHRLLMQESGWRPQQAYTKQNMAMGFGYIVPDLDTAERVCDRINQRGENTAKIVGQVARNGSDQVTTNLHLGGEVISFVGYNG